MWTPLSEPPSVLSLPRHRNVLECTPWQGADVTMVYRWHFQRQPLSSPSWDCLVILGCQGDSLGLNVSDSVTVVCWFRIGVWGDIENSISQATVDWSKWDT